MKKYFSQIFSDVKPQYDTTAPRGSAPRIPNPRVISKSSLRKIIQIIEKAKKLREAENPDEAFLL